MGRPVIDLTDKQFGNWMVLKRVKNKGTRPMWLCECQCDNKTQQIIDGSVLRHNKLYSCNLCRGKIKYSVKNNDLTNQKFGCLTALEPTEERRYNQIVWKCICDCGSYINVASSKLKHGGVISCGCVKSKGEQKIAQLLTNAKISFIRQKTFDNCRFPDTNYPAIFDFYVDNKYIIEYDGLQYFKSVDFWGGEQGLKYNMAHDEYKTQWCKDNNIALIRISYKQLDNLILEDLLL